MDKETWMESLKNGAYSNEFDWIAVDKIGQLAIFTAILHAPIPQKIGRSFEAYTELMNLINQLEEKKSAKLVTGNSGDLSDWLTYSYKGLFTFDFQDVHRKNKLNQYDLIAVPSTPLIIEELDLKDDLIKIIPKFNCNFRDGDVKNEIISQH